MQIIIIISECNSGNLSRVKLTLLFLQWIIYNIIFIKNIIISDQYHHGMYSNLSFKLHNYHHYAWMHVYRVKPVDSTSLKMGNFKSIIEREGEFPTFHFGLVLQIFMTFVIIFTCLRPHSILASCCLWACMSLNLTYSICRLLQLL